MSWFSGSSVPLTELDAKIAEATSESIPNGEIDISVALEITDLIRSRKIPPKQCMRSLKKRLINTHPNPNLLVSTLKLIDLCVKNGGYHFLVEFASKEFMDYLIDYVFKIHYNTKDFRVSSDFARNNVGEFILKLLKEWRHYFQNQLQLSYVDKLYTQLLNQGYHFPEIDENVSQFSSTFVDSDAPPDWIDSDECMICYNAFSVLNRKHHCRSCGGVFCQTHSSHSIPLIHLGILEPVRVCDNCYEKVKSKNSGNLKKVQDSGQNRSHQKSRSLSSPDDNDIPETEDEQLRKAIELSLRESGVQVDNTAPAPQPPASPPRAASSSRNDAQENEEDDDEMKAAIAASLKEFKAQEELYKQQAQSQPSFQSPPVATHQPQSDFYSNILPFGQGSQNFEAQQQQQQQHQQQQQQFATPPHQFAGQAPSQQQLPAQATKPSVDDLSQQEEESINLFITLMNSTKSDPQKSNNIVYDSKLSELHNKVVQLKPKLNKSLRVSIERYDHFLELNNKISTITRLYDQYLESKLNQAYNSHYISDYAPQQQQAQHQQQRPQQPQQFTGGQILQRPADVPRNSSQHTQQFTGGQIPQRPADVSRNSSQHTSSAPYPIEDARSQNSPPLLNSPPTQYPGSSAFNQSGSPPLPAAAAPATQPSFFYPEYQSSDVAAPPSHTGYSDSRAQSFQHQTVAPTASSDTQYPSYPPGDSDEEDSESDAESVATRFPEVEHNDSYADAADLSKSGLPSKSQQFQRVQSANSRFPPIERIDSGYSQTQSPAQETPSQQQQSIPPMPSMPQFGQPLSQTKSSGSSHSKHRVEPEPLIEL